MPAWAVDKGKSRRFGLDQVDRAGGHGLQEGPAVTLGQNAVVQHDDDPGIGPGANEAAQTLTEPEQNT